MKRIITIDVFRAMTMCLMIFVNDLWTLKGVPKWLLHTEMDEDGMGFSDLIFPVFLVIVGMSLPFAVANRRKKGDDGIALLKHVGERTAALLIMGFCLVNYEYLPAASIPFAKSWVGMYLVICFFLCWNNYPSTFRASKFFKVLGVLGLLAFAWWYPGGPLALKPHWWGILGLIGWSYLWAAMAYLVFGKNLAALLAVTVFFLLFCLLAHMGYLQAFQSIKSYVWLVDNGALPFLCMLGVLASEFYRRQTFGNYAVALLVIGTCLILLGFILRPYGGISKILATPAWVCICGGIAYVWYAVLYYIVDAKGYVSWANILRPAGVATLTCYLVPYFWYGIRALTGWRLPDGLLQSPIGLVMSLGVALVIVQLTGLLIKRGVQLKV